MDVPREQYDELLGGRQELPSTVSIIKYVDARRDELAALTEAIEEPQNNHLAFQKMPRHLRRRAMSHNYKRMPRRLRDVHFHQMEKSGLPTKSKRPCRKFRRRPQNLLQEYNRRQRTAVWLETHIWHAKRFHMTQQWGYKLAHFPNDKNFRACYRATAKHCLIQDVSYLNCIELHGAEGDILEALGQLTSPECGLTFAAKSSLSGSREGAVVVFKRHAYPFHAIGRVTFMWRPEHQHHKRTLWIWSHPAFYNEFLQELISLFDFKAVESSNMDVDTVDDSIKITPKSKKLPGKNKNVERVKLETKNIGKLPKYTNGSVDMVLLKDTLNRFRLTGPLSQVVLTEAFKCVEINDFIRAESNGDKMEVEGDETPRSAWLSEFYNSRVHLDSLELQNHFFGTFLKNVSSASELPPRMILPVTVLDPRLSMPASRVKAVYTEESTVQATIPPGLSCGSPLWDPALRDTVSFSKMAAAQLNSLRSRALVPGLVTPAWLGLHNVSHLPLLLVQTPGCRGDANQRGYGSGWDVIFPAGWGMAVWLGLVYRGARPGGLRETERLTLESGSGPTLSPDTEAGHRHSEQHGKARQERHFRLPPDKRPNYVKLGVVAPFHCPWEKLLQDWYPEKQTQGFYVIRSRNKLDYLSGLLNRTKSAPCMFTDSDRACGLVQVGVEVCGRGNLRECAMICALGKKDSKLTKDKTGRGPTEPLHEDVNEEARKTLREAHQRKLKKLRKKRVKAKRELEEKGIFSVKTKTFKSPTEEVVSKQAEVMRELWLPSEVDSVKNSSSRSVIGFVCAGGYSFTHSQSYGYGFVALSALLGLLQRNQNHFLARNISSVQYYFVRLKVSYPV